MAYYKDNDGDYRPALWNFPSSLELPRFLKEDIQKSLTYRDKQDLEIEAGESNDSEEDCSEDDCFLNVPYKDLKSLYLHLRGCYEVPEKLRTIGSATITMLRCTTQPEHLKKLAEDDLLLNWNSVVIWGPNRNRSLPDLFSQVAPKNYSTSNVKNYILRYIKGDHFHFAQQYGLNTTSYEYSCLGCDKRFDTPALLVEHVNRENAEITYMCRHCGYLRFTNVCALIYHGFTDLHTKPTLHYCLVCRRLYKSLPDHLTEMSKFLDAWKAECKECGFVAFSKCSYSLHLSYHLKELPYLCPECGEFFIRKELLTEHMNKVCYINSKCKFFLCSACYVMFSDLDHFSSHITSEHYERRVKCVECSEVFSTQFELVAHRKKEHPESGSTYHVFHFCELCPGLTFKGISQQAHLANHSKEDKCYTVLYKCGCNFYTRFKETFIDHKKSNKCVEKLKRPQVLKICEECKDVKSYSNTESFMCEECQVRIEPRLNIVHYYCQLCLLVLEFNWSEVQDHFFFNHKSVDFQSIGSQTMMIVGNKTITPGRVLNKYSVSVTDLEGMNEIIVQMSSAIEKWTEKLSKLGLPNSKPQSTENQPHEETASEERAIDPQSLPPPPLIPCTTNANRLRIKTPQDINALHIQSNEEGENSTNLQSKRKGASLTTNSDKSDGKSKKVVTKAGKSAKGKQLIVSKPSSQDIFHCRMCSFTSTNKSEILTHSLKCNKMEVSTYSIDHDKTVSFPCSRCGSRFESNEERVNHLSQVHGFPLIPEKTPHLEEVLKQLKDQGKGKTSNQSQQKHISGTAPGRISNDYEQPGCSGLNEGSHGNQYIYLDDNTDDED